MQISDGQVVTIEYTLKDADGVLVESSEGRGPITFKLGSDRMLPGVAKAIEGMTVGESRSVDAGRALAPGGDAHPADPDR